MNLLDFKNVRRFENFYTGAGLTKAGKATAGLAGAGYVGKNIWGTNTASKMAKKAPGIRSAPQMSQDMKRTPTMGASGSLTLALSDFGGNLKK